MAMHRIRVCVFLLCVFGGATASQAQLSGTVVNAYTKQPFPPQSESFLPFVRVELFACLSDVCDPASLTALSAVAVTDGTGAFQIATDFTGQPLGAGPMHVRAILAGAETAPRTMRNIVVLPNQALDIGILAITPPAVVIGTLTTSCEVFPSAGGSCTFGYTLTNLMATQVSVWRWEILRLADTSPYVYELLFEPRPAERRGIGIGETKTVTGTITILGTVPDDASICLDAFVGHNYTRLKAQLNPTAHETLGCFLKGDAYLAPLATIPSLALGLSRLLPSVYTH